MKSHRPPASVQDLIDVQRETLQNVSELRLQQQTLLFAVERSAKWQEHLSQQVATLARQEERLTQCLSESGRNYTGTVSWSDTLETKDAVVPAAAVAPGFACCMSGLDAGKGKKKKQHAFDSLQLETSDQYLEPELDIEEEPTKSRQSRNKPDLKRGTSSLNLDGPEHGRIIWNEGGVKLIQSFASFIVHWRKFDYLMGLVILANSICIGMEIEQELPCVSGDPDVVLHDTCDTSMWADLNIAFLVIYMVELVLRFVAEGKDALKSGWVCFDIFLVVSGSVSTFIVVPLMGAGNTKDPALQTLGQLMVIRIARLGRLARALRLFESCKNLWKLVQGVLKSFGTMGSACIVLLIFLYIFACIGVEVLRKDEEMMANSEMNAVILERFGNIPMTMLTLMQFYTMDSIAGFYYPLIVFKPELAIFFGMVFVVVSISLMNMVTALIVQNAMESAAEDEQMQLAERRTTMLRLAEPIEQIFRTLDKTGDGSVTLEEVGEAIKAGELHFPPEVEHRIPQDQLMDIFELLDSDCSGAISADEFKLGINQIVLSHVPIETTQIVQMLKTLVRGQTSQGDELLGLRKRVDQFFDINV